MQRGVIDAITHEGVDDVTYILKLSHYPGGAPRRYVRPWWRSEGSEGSQVHANVVFVNVDATQADPARRGLHDQVIPRVSQTSGFVAGYWLEPLDGKGISVTLWGSEEAAREAAGLIHPASSPTTGVKVDRIETREVIGQA